MSPSVAFPEAEDRAWPVQLQQGFATSGMGISGDVARQQSCVAHVRFGSKADMASPSSDLRFTPESGRRH
jgi:hypothetical protein